MNLNHFDGICDLMHRLSQVSQTASRSNTPVTISVFHSGVIFVRPDRLTCRIRPPVDLEFYFRIKYCQ